MIVVSLRGIVASNARPAFASWCAAGLRSPSSGSSDGAKTKSQAGSVIAGQGGGWDRVRQGDVGGVRG